MPCVLRISGRSFDAAAFAARTSMPVVKVYVRGEPRISARPDGPKNLTSGVNIHVSNADFTNLAGQIRSALRFLERYESELRRASRNPGVEELTLDFGITRRDIAVQSDRLPATIVAAAGHLGIALELSQYPVSG